MTEPQADTPVSLRVIGWAWAAVGIAMAFSGTMALLVFPMVSAGSSFDRTTGSAIFDFVFDHFVAIAIVQLAVAVSIIAGAIGTLKRRRWGAIVVGAAACLGLVYILAFSAAFLHLVITVAPTSSDPPVNRTSMAAFLMVAVAFNALFWGTPLGLTLYVLSRPHVRAVLESRGRPTKS